MERHTTPAHDPKEFRAALGSFATGVTVITARAVDGTPVGLTANSFNSVSLDPPMVLWSLAKKSFSLAAFTAAQHWAVHVLAADQEPLSNRFARPSADKFAGLELEHSAAGVPLLKDCAARFQCKTSFQYEGGDHVIFVGEVESFDRSDHPPLVFHAGRYALATQKDPSLPPAGSARVDHAFNEDLLGYMLSRAYAQFHEGMRGPLREQGLSDPQWRVITMATVRPTLTAAFVDQVTMSSMVLPSQTVLDSLVASGWMVADAGTGAFRLTADGRDRSLHLLAAAKSREVDLLGKLGYVDGALLKSVLHRFIRLTSPGVPSIWESD